MIKYNTVYRGQFYNTEEVVITVDIYDTRSGVVAEPTNIIELDMAENPCTLESVDNDEDKFSAIIRSLRAVVNIFSSDTIGIETFVDGGDTSFFGHVYTEDNIELLRGFVSVADVSEDFLPDPNVITLIINDGLGFLGDVEMSDDNGDVITGVKTLLYWLRTALSKTGHDCGIVAVWNIREDGAPTANSAEKIEGHILNYNRMDARTFEGQNPGTMVTAREALEILLKGLYITFWNGSWLIVNIDEMITERDTMMFSVDENGENPDLTRTAFRKNIGVDDTLSWMNEDCIVTAERPLRKESLKRRYDYFAEIPCNIDFERGTGSDPTGAVDETIDYTPDCWLFRREGSTPAGLDSYPDPASTGVLRKRFEYNYEKERYLVVGTGGGFRHYFRSEGIRMAEGSKINIGFQWRSETDTAGVTVNVAHMRLRGDDGNFYDWVLTTAGVSSWSGAKVSSDPVFDDTWQQTISGIDDSEWQSISGTSQPTPVAGTLYIRLLNDLSTPIRHFTALTVDYTPLINNSYAKYTGEEHTVEQEGDYKALREDEIVIGTGPDLNVKGTIMKRGDDFEIYSGSADFGNANNFDTSGDNRNIFEVGQEIVITGSGSNNITGVITAVNYIIGDDLTSVITDQVTVIELGATITVSLITYSMSGLMYNADAFPDGIPDASYAHPYGEIISFNIWNQYNRVMRKFDGTVDGLETDIAVDNLPPSFVYIFTMTDPNLNTGNRIFGLLHFSQNLHLCEWKGFFHEVYNPDNGKSYLGHSYKYLTE